MARPPLLDLELYPPFEGFPEEGIRFLKQLKKNNNRQWFQAHKSEYETFVKLPMQSLIVALRGEFARFAPEIELHPKRSMFRIYRDIRFSKNKAPYKTHAASVFHPKGHWQACAGYYLHIEPREVFLGGGVYMPPSDQLRDIRRALVEQSEEFLSIVNDKSFRRRFSELEGDKLQRIPQGYNADHPMAEWLKYKWLYAGVTWPHEKSFSSKFVHEATRVYEQVTPLVRFLNNAMRKG
ncbi:MAG: DUF2461 domain-containing protein [Bacteroidota bacterium]